MAFAVRVALLCALIPATLGAGGGGDLARLLDRMRAAAGPLWRAHVVSISRVSVTGGNPVVATDSQGVRFALRRCSGELCNGTYFDGYRLYTLDMNDTALPQSRDMEPYLRSLRLIASLAFLAPDFTRVGRRVDDDGVAVLAGRRYRSIFVVDPYAIPMQLYVDPQSALVRYARAVNGEDIFEYRDYRHVDGLAMPFEVLHNGSVLERYDDQTPVGSAFAPPRGLPPVFSGAPAPVATDPEKTTPIFPCTLAGVVAHCLLDTGNSGLSISSELASRLGVPVVGTLAVRGGLGAYSTQVVHAGSLQIGNATYPGAYYVVLNDIRRYGYDVVVGADLLASTRVGVDAAAHDILLGAIPPSGSIDVPISFESFVPVADVQLGTLATRLAVDTGDESNINLSYDFFAKHPGLFTPTRQRTVGGVGGTSTELIGEIGAVTIGGYNAGEQSIGTTQTLQGTAFGHLGSAFLARFNVVLDYAAATLHLTPYP